MNKTYALGLFVALAIGFVAGMNFEEMQVTGATVKETNENGLPSDFREKLKGLVTFPDDATIAIIDNVDLAQSSQPQIYENAKNGDYVIAFGDTVIIYDYKENKLRDKVRLVKGQA